MKTRYHAYARDRAAYKLYRLEQLGSNWELRSVLVAHARLTGNPPGTYRRIKSLDLRS
jgi:hypothetical protein